MANTIKIKISTVAGVTPTTLALGELAINIPDKTLFWYDGSVIQNFTLADRASIPFVLITPTGTTTYGNGVDSRIPALSMLGTTVNYGWFLGQNSGPWSNVDVYLAWVEGSAMTGNIVVQHYLNSFVNGGSITKTSSPKVTIASSGVLYRYHESLLQSNVTITPNAMVSASLIRQGTDPANTSTATIGVIGIILKPH